MTSHDLFRELGDLDWELVATAAPDQVVPRNKKNLWKRLLPCAAALVVLIGILFTDPVSAAIRELFSFIPGIGIQSTTGKPVYSFVPVKNRVEAGSVRAQVLRASYMDSALSVTVLIEGRAVYYEDFTFSVNNEPQDLSHYHNSYSLAVSSDSTMLHISYPMDTPKATDLFTIQISGIQECLAFTLTPCHTYEELLQIGPTVTHNGISITVTANRIGNDLEVWCYETRDDTATADELVGFGSPVNGSSSLRHFIETESGRIHSRSSGWVISNRMVFPLAQSDRTATLHIPYLSMYRKERQKCKIQLPKGHETIDPNIAVETSLGWIRVVSAQRTPHQENSNQDRILLTLKYESVDPNQQLYALHYDIQGTTSYADIIHSTDSNIRYVEVIVDSNTTTLNITINGLYYFLMEEYVIPLKIQE